MARYGEPHLFSSYVCDRCTDRRSPTCITLPESRGVWSSNAKIDTVTHESFNQLQMCSSTSSRCPFCQSMPFGIIRCRFGIFIPTDIEYECRGQLMDKRSCLADPLESMNARACPFASPEDTILYSGKFQKLPTLATRSEMELKVFSVFRRLVRCRAYAFSWCQTNIMLFTGRAINIGFEPHQARELHVLSLQAAQLHTTQTLALSF